MYKTSPCDQTTENTPPHTTCCPVFIKYFEGYKYDEIAECLNLPVNVVKERLKNNKRNLSANLQLYVKQFKAAHFSTA